MKKKIIRITGLVGLVSYTVVILYAWISANLGGYVYFQAGEPVWLIKYPEWVLGIIGIFVAVELLFNEIYRLRCIIMDDLEVRR